MKIKSFHSTVWIKNTHKDICLVRSCISKILVPGLQITSGPKDKLFSFGFRATNLDAKEECEKIIKAIQVSGVEIQKGPY